MAIRLTKKERSVIGSEGEFGDDGSYWIYLKYPWRVTIEDVISIRYDTKEEAYLHLRDWLDSGIIAKDPDGWNR